MFEILTLQGIKLTTDAIDIFSHRLHLVVMTIQWHIIAIDCNL